MPCSKQAARSALIPSLLLMLSLTNCSAVDLLNRAAWRGGLNIHNDIAYASGPRHRLDVYAPRDATNAPVAVFFYGGGWTEGSKDQYAFVATALAQRGIVTMVPDYRVYPETRFPGFIEDGAQAVRWARDHARDYGGDPSRIVLVGHSAGAYIAAMLTLDPKWLAVVGLDSRRDVAGCVGLAGPYDFLPLRDPVLETIFAPAGDLALSQPIHYVDGKAPPMLLLAGEADRTVYPSNSRNLAARIRTSGGQVETVFYPGIDHARIIAAFAWPLRFLVPSLQAVTAFIDRTAKIRDSYRTESPFAAGVEPAS
jgi:acetyl esterase/lipase